MSESDEATYYDILDVAPDASPQKVREAYVRIKSTFNRDNPALYTLITPEERESTLKKVEEAFHILSDPEAKRSYDQSYGVLEEPKQNFSSENLISIDRTPPMESISDDIDLLVPPRTDFEEDPFITKSQAPQAPSPRVLPRDARATLGKTDGDLALQIDLEKEWKGSFLKRVRNAYQISLEEMSGVTKITKSYLIAIEDEDFKKLPAPVYIRGFVMQIAKVLRLPPEIVAKAYLSRYYSPSR